MVLYALSHEKDLLTDLSEREWACLKTHIPASMLLGTMRAHSLGEIFDAIFYDSKSGCPQRLRGTSLQLVNARSKGERPSGPIEQTKDLWDLTEPRRTPDMDSLRAPIFSAAPEPRCSRAPQRRSKRLCSRGKGSQQSRGPNT